MSTYRVKSIAPDFFCIEAPDNHCFYAVRNGETALFIDLKSDGTELGRSELLTALNIKSFTNVSTHGTAPEHPGRLKAVPLTGYRGDAAGYLEPQLGLFFCGEFLSVGLNRLTLPESSLPDYQKSLALLKSLPELKLPTAQIWTSQSPFPITRPYLIRVLGMLEDLQMGWVEPAGPVPAIVPFQEGVRFEKDDLSFHLKREEWEVIRQASMVYP